MSAKDANQHALQRLVKWIAPRLYENEPDSEQSERAMRALSGQLGSNPPFVIDAFDLGVSQSAWIVDVTISPNGKVAIVVGEHVDETSSRVLLTTWPRPSGYSEFRDLGVVSDDIEVHVLFPEGSSEPAVIIGGEKLVWGNWTLELPWKEEHEVPKDACFTLWEDADYFQHATYIEDGVPRLETTAVAVYSTHVKNVRWMGLVNGSFAVITSEDPDGQCETLRWCNVEAIMLRGEQIIPESIGLVDGGLQFVAREENGRLAVYGRNAQHRMSVFDQSMWPCLWGDGRVIGCGHFSKQEGQRIYSTMDRGEFKEIATMSQGQGWIKDDAQVFDFGDHVTIVEPWQGTTRRVIDVRLETGTLEVSPIISGPRTGFLRAHHGLVYQTVVTGNHAFLWNDFGAERGKRPSTVTFPLYSRFDALTPIEDARGKAIMSWAYAEGTFAVVRYPLPNK